MNSYDVIVIGTGGVGSAALFHLARRGARVLGLDRFPGGHDRGSSHGQTRAIRQAYFEHPDYVPLLRRAYPLWAELEQLEGRQLYHEVGVLQVGPTEGIVIPGVLEAARQHKLAVQQLAPADVERRFPGFRVGDDFLAVFEEQAGYLQVEPCVLAHLNQAARLGAEIHAERPVRHWTADTGGGVTVHTNSQTYTAGRLVIAAGAWSEQLLAGLDIHLKVLRKHLYWFAARTNQYREDRGAPVFFYEQHDGLFYGFPQVDAQGVKVGEHSGGEVVPDPLEVNREIDSDDQNRVQRFLASSLPGVSDRTTDHTVCMYTMTADEHFIVDVHPLHEQVSFAAGLSGHGFKFTAVLGEILADLALEGKTEQPIQFLSCHR